MLSLDVVLFSSGLSTALGYFTINNGFQMLNLDRYFLILMSVFGLLAHKITNVVFN